MLSHFRLRKPNFDGALGNRSDFPSQNYEERKSICVVGSICVMKWPKGALVQKVEGERVVGEERKEDSRKRKSWNALAGVDGYNVRCVL